MLNVEKIRLMVQLSIYEKKEGKGIIETSKYFKGDYISRGILTASIYYTLCFIVISIIIAVVNIEEVLLHLNISFIIASLQSILYIYLAGMVIIILGAYIRCSISYDNAHRKSLFYTAKLDKLLRMQENEFDYIDVTKDEAEYYKETGGSIRVYDDISNTWESIHPRFRTYVKDGGELSDPEGGWLDDPIANPTKEHTPYSKKGESQSGWLDEDMDDDRIDVLNIRKRDK
ncbi:hypothetical protein [Oribacterium sp. FC2011]|uniref:hypothetical protein n=1 Tax=Oribacterium sp. FC2011 TaxID=1408311 RepID=UPI0004E208CB|nr:hypothetical protein [Oribacterium sp. FC2011]